MTEYSNWTFRIKNASGDVIVNLLGAKKRVIKLGLNKAGEASFVYELEELHDLADKLGYSVNSLVGLGRHTLECLRGSTTYFAGQLIEMKKSLNADSAEVEIKALGFFWLLGTRYVGIDEDKEYTDTDAGSIAWDLINTVQIETYGDFGITQGTLQTSLNRTISYSRKSVKEAIEELAMADNGFDFEITASKVFNAYYPQKGSDISDSVVFRYPSNHVVKIEEIRDVSELANSVFAIGSGFGLEEVNAERDNVDSQMVFNIREKILPIKDMPNATVLGDIADQYLNMFGQVIPYYKIRFNNSDDFSPNLGSFNLGDSIGIKIEEDYFEVNQSFRVFEVVISIQDNDLEMVDLVVGLI